MNIDIMEVTQTFLLIVIAMGIWLPYFEEFEEGD